MAYVITFTTARFDIASETPNPVNPIAGQAVLAWLRDEFVKTGWFVTEPDHEDWGWYMDVRNAGASYMVGASADATDPAPPNEWTIQLHKHRSVTDKLMGRNKLAPDDAVLALLERLVRADSAFENVDAALEP